MLRTSQVKRMNSRFFNENYRANLLKTLSNEKDGKAEFYLEQNIAIGLQNKRDLECMLLKFWSEQSRFDSLFLPGQDNVKERDFKQFVLLSMLSYGVLNMVAAQSRGIPSRREKCDRDLRADQSNVTLKNCPMSVAAEFWRSSRKKGAGIWQGKEIDWV